MSGLRKAKKYDWKDSNLALFGSDTEKQVKKESAETEPAWHGAGQSVGLQIWRINKFKVEAWPKEDYGNFYTGDSYIILNTYKDKESDELLYDVHFWIGKYSTQDEYGTAAYKTVELDTLLDDKPVQHRECQDHESPLFRSYFKNLTFMEGGADSGFRHVLPEQYIPRLMHCKKVGPRSFEVKEVKRSKTSLRDEDVFILDTGLICYLWNGKECSRDESFKAAQYLQTLISQRNGKPTKEVLDAGDISDSHPFYDYLNDDNDDDDDDDEQEEETTVKLLRVSDADGSLDLEPVKEGGITKDDLDSNDVMIIDSGKNCSVWIGSGASIDEKRNAMAYADKYLKTTNHSVIPITIMVEGSRATIPGVA